MRDLSRQLRAVVLAAATALLALLAVLAVPGTASAATTPGIGTVPTNTITPLLDCVQKNKDGSVTAILGYTNASTRTQTITVGSLNQIAPSRFSGTQPTTFKPGTQHGVLSLPMTNSEYMGGDYWYVDGNFAYFGWTWTQNGPFCAPGTSLPATGNGTGIAIGLLAAGLVGGLVVRRVRRRTTGPTPRAVPAG
jgi:LPXTG-motif cell wall-anchored protein